ncbi:TonB-dependent receptor [Porticoccus sp. GXU_MW_L64]
MNVLRLKPLAAALSGVIAASFAPGVLAADNAASTEINEEIVVRGIRGSLKQALSLKKEATNFVDAISAEDAGKLPDQNIAEALQRVTGVAIQRSRGEGDFVSIRGLGPDFVRGTINGRSITSGTETFDSTLSGGTATSTGRATNFDLLPSEIIDTLEVIKSTSAKHVEGGIGGVVNVKTARPLDTENRTAFNIKGTYRDFAEETDPNVSGMINWSNDSDTFGILASIAYSERNIREDISGSFGYLPFGTYDTDGDGLEDRSDVIVPLSSNQDSFEEGRDRTTFNSTLQWAFGEDSQLTLDLLYSDRDIEQRQQGVIFVSLPTVGANDDGSVTVSPNDIVGGALRSITSNIPPELVNDEQVANDEQLNLALNYTTKVGDWTLSTDISSADAEGTLAFDRAVTVGDGGGTYLIDYTVDESGFTVVSNGTADLSNPANYFLRNGRVTRTINEDEESAFQFDATREIDSNFLSSVEIGARYRTREKSVTRSDFDGGFGLGTTLRLSDISGGATAPASNFLDGGTVTAFGDLVFANTQPALDAVRAAAGAVDITPQLDPLGTFDVEEDTYAFYTQLNLDGEIGGIGYVGDVGFRVVLTEQEITGLSQPFTIDGTTTPGSIVFTGPVAPITFDDSYVNVLPSLNLRFELDEGLFLRLAASKTVTRPTFVQLSPRVAINPSATADLNGDGIAATANLGNTSLSPYESTNYDLGVEYYFGDASALYAGVYYKEIEDFIANVTNLDVTFSGTVFDSVSQPDNQGVAQLIGLEAGYQQSFENGFGYIINASISENDAEFEDGGDISFPGVSDLSYNITGYYDNGPLQARLAYSYRDDFLLNPSDVFTNQIFVEEFGQLDASVSFDITDNFTLSLEFLNLTDENLERTTSNTSGLGSQFLSDGVVGRRVAFGFRGRF